MKYSALIFFLSLFISHSSFSQNVTYYFDAVSGNDSNSGTSTSSPWKTTSKFNNTTFKSGDKALFKRGQTWGDGSFLLVTTPNLTIGKYGASGDRPIISNLKDIKDGHWTPMTNAVGELIWYKTVQKAIHRLFIDDTEVLRAWNEDEIGLETGPEDTMQEWYYENLKLYVRSPKDPSTQFNSIKTSVEGGAVTFSAVNGNNAWNCQIIDMDIRGGINASIVVTEADNILIDHCTIGENSLRGVLAEGDSNNVNNLTISESWIDSGFNFKYGRALDTSYSKSGEQRGAYAGIEFRDAVTNSTIISNRIKDWGHSGIDFTANKTTSLGVNTNKVIDNYITNVNLSYGRGIGVDGRNYKCFNNEFKSNIIRDCKAPVQFNGNNNIFHHNIIYGTKNPDDVYPGDNKGKGIVFSVYQTYLVCYGHKIDNNVIMNNDGLDVEFHNYYPSDSTIENIYFRNNMVFTNITNDVVPTVLEVDPSVVGKNYFQNNLFKTLTSVPYNKIIDYKATTYNITGFNNLYNPSITYSGPDYVSGNIGGDPLVDENDSYNVASTSPCIDAGIDIEYSNTTNDFDGDPFPSGGQEDIGMQEFISTLRQRKKKD